MKNKYHLRRLIMLLIFIILFSLFAAILGTVNALKFYILLLTPILILLFGFYFLAKNPTIKGKYFNFLVISIAPLMFFAFVFLAMAFDPRNKTPFGWNTLLISGSVGIFILLLECIAMVIQKDLKK